ncbi:beta-lactamase family protein [Paenibacillus melissococcoides]|uniref:Beta-lactamase family protein n=2 Tax=Paenibacillus melissococcoides TaxID=2912268 RepID=A0ABM9G2H3_9BACL|nr:beta-lactamase family protein [Paenibacillus melissococcoides]
MKRRGMVLMLLCALLGSVLMAFPSSAGAKSAAYPDLEAFVDEVVKAQMEKYDMTNAAVGVVEGGEVRLAKGYGYADREKRVQADAERTLFRIGSTSKLLTWTAVMQLVEQGKLDLNADINRYLDVKIPPQLIHSPDQAEPITLTHLMTHTPGFEDSVDSIFRLSADEMLPLQEYIRAHLPARVFPPGKVSAYSNYGAALAGYIVERVSGQPFAEYVEQHIFAPLGMGRSSFLQPLPEALAQNLAKAYHAVDGGYAAGKFEYLLPGPAGSMSSTASDMARFMLAHLQGGRAGERRILQKDTVERMHRQQFTQHPKLGGMTFGFMEGMLNGQRILFQNGNTMLFDTGLYLLPEQGAGIFVSYTGGSYLAHNELFQAFMDRYYPSPRPALEPTLAGSVERGHAYVGEYHQNRRNFTTGESMVSLMMGTIAVDMEEDGHLLVTHGGETNRFVEVEPGIYHNLREGRTQDYFGEFRTIIFDRDPYGNIMLMSDGPMTYSQAPWYGTSSFTMMALLFAVLMVAGSSLYWLIGAIVRQIRRRSERHPAIVSAARWTAVAYGLLTVLAVAGMASAGKADPVYGLPATSYMEPPAWQIWIDRIPIVLAGLGALIVLHTLLLWWKRYGRFGARIHYTLFALAAAGMLELFYYWNII